MTNKASKVFIRPTNVTDLDDYRDIWESAWINYYCCGYGCIATYVPGTPNLECPDCGRMTTYEATPLNDKFANNGPCIHHRSKSFIEWFKENILFISWHRYFRGVYIHFLPKYVVRVFLWGFDWYKKPDRREDEQVHS